MCYLLLFPCCFYICSLCLIFVNLINMCLGVFRLGFILFGTLCFLDLGDYFLPHFREVFNYYFLKYFLMVFLFVFFFWDSYNSDVEAFNIVPEVSEVVLIFFKFFFPLFHLYLPFYLLPHLSYLLPPLFCFGSLQSVFDLIYCIIHYILTLFKISSRFLLNLSCIFSILSPGYLSVTPFCFQDFGSFSLS